jgi:hypothetical protein
VRILQSQFQCNYWNAFPLQALLQTSARGDELSTQPPSTSMKRVREDERGVADGDCDGGDGDGDDLGGDELIMNSELAARFADTIERMDARRKQRNRNGNGNSGSNNGNSRRKRR